MPDTSKEARSGKVLVVSGGPITGPDLGIWARMLSKTKCPSSNDFLRPDDFEYCTAATFHKALLSRDVKSVLALGEAGLAAATGEQGIKSLRGYVFTSGPRPVVATYDPEFIRKGKWALARVVQLDVLKALEVAARGVDHLHVDKTYELSPAYHEVESFFMEWRAAGRPPIAFDIETPRADEAADAEDMVFEDDASYTILMISFSWAPYKAISIPWVEPFVSMVKEAFNEPADFLVWNAKFDVPRLMASGIHFGGRIVDVMLAWHWLEPSLPMGLKYVATFFCPDMQAWKLEMHRNFQWYNAADSDVLLRVFLEVRKRLEEQGRWKTFERHFLDFGAILAKMTERGVVVDHVARKKARDHFEERFGEVVRRAGELAPPALGNTSPKRGYVRTPEDCTGMVQIEVELTEAEIAKRRKEADRAREKARKEREKRERKAQREEARRVKEMGKANAKPRKPRKGKLAEAG